MAARYYGLPSPACQPLLGLQIAGTRLRMDAFGTALASATLPGDGWRRQHDMLKWRLDEDMREMGIRSRTEVFGIFASALPVSARLEAGRRLAYGEGSCKPTAGLNTTCLP